MGGLKTIVQNVGEEAVQFFKTGGMQIFAKNGDEALKAARTTSVTKGMRAAREEMEKGTAELLEINGKKYVTVMSPDGNHQFKVLESLVSKKETWHGQLWQGTQRAYYWALAKGRQLWGQISRLWSGTILKSGADAKGLIVPQNLKHIDRTKQTDLANVFHKDKMDDIIKAASDKKMTLAQAHADVALGNGVTAKTFRIDSNDAANKALFEKTTLEGHHVAGYQITSPDKLGLDLAKPAHKALADQLQAGDLVTYKITGSNQIDVSTINWVKPGGEITQEIADQANAAIYKSIRKTVDKPENYILKFANSADTPANVAGLKKADNYVIYGNLQNDFAYERSGAGLKLAKRAEQLANVEEYRQSLKTAMWD